VNQGNPLNKVMSSLIESGGRAMKSERQHVRSVGPIGQTGEIPRDAPGGIQRGRPGNDVVVLGTNDHDGGLDLFDRAGDPEEEVVRDYGRLPDQVAGGLDNPVLGEDLWIVRIEAHAGGWRVHVAEELGLEGPGEEESPKELEVGEEQLEVAVRGMLQTSTVAVTGYFAM